MIAGLALLLLRAPAPAERFALAPPIGRVGRVGTVRLLGGTAGPTGKRASRRRRQAAGAPAPAPGAPVSPAEASDGSVLQQALGFGWSKQPRKALEIYDRAVDDPSDLPLRHVYGAVSRALLKAERTDLALELHTRHTGAHPSELDVNATVRLFLAVLRAPDGVPAARELLRSIDDLSPPPAAEGGSVGGGAAAATETERAVEAAATEDGPGEEPLWRALNARALPALVLRQLRDADTDGALRVARRLAATASADPAGVPADESCARMVREFGKAKSMRGVYACLDALAGAPVADADLNQALVDALVHDVSFVKGGVSAATLPTGTLAEVAFVGRSNVGKSSLVNMVLGRRAIAYTSKTPGKTQQYNYFEVNRGRPEGAFHLVDFPGLGYAKAPAYVRRRWSDFICEYLRDRQQVGARRFLPGDLGDFPI